MRYTREDGCRAWLTYAPIRADILQELLDTFGTAESIYDRFMSNGRSFLKKYVNEYGLSMLAEHAQPEMMHQMLITMKRLDIGIISQNDALFPDNLRNIQLPPALLFYRGNLNCLTGKCIAVVGSRKASSHGLEVTRNICRDLSNAGVCIISGLAMGIDTAAHEGCLEGKSPTAAVLGSGIDVDYPIDNVRLKEQIIHTGGVLLSEYPPGTHANKYVFQVRNRLISGLSKALLMMESRIQSGSTLTVQHALDQGREVFAYPGIPGTEWAEGAHQLLREGANYFTSARDILEDLGWDNIQPLLTSEFEKSEMLPMSEEQRSVLIALNQGELSFDQLSSALQMTAPTLSVTLTMLQMMGLVKALPGKTYCRV